MGDFLDKLSSVSKDVAKKTAEMAGEGAKKAAELAGEGAKKAKEMSDSTKVSAQINTEREVLRKKYQKLGETFYKKYGKKDTGDVVLSRYCDLVDRSIATIKEYNEELQKIKGVPICFLCSKEVSNQKFYCVHCGHRTERDLAEREKIEIEQAPTALANIQVIEGKRCGKCRVETEYEDFYCGNCGVHLKEEIW